MIYDKIVQKYQEQKPLDSKVSLVEDEEIPNLIRMISTVFQENTGVETGTEETSFYLNDLISEKDKLQTIIDNMNLLITDCNSL